MTDDLSGNMAMPVSPSPSGDTYRGFGADWFNAGNISREDFNRQVQMADYAFQQDLYQMQLANQFNSSEAQKNRDWQEMMSNTAYQRAISDMKSAGINPILAFNQGSASTPSGSAATTSSSPRRGYPSYNSIRSSGDSNLVYGLIKILSGALSGNPLPVVSGFTDVATSSYTGNGDYLKTYTRSYDFKKDKK